MKLMDVDTYNLQEFFGTVGEGIPEYGILSHMWGDDEVTFSDLKDGLRDRKKGWYKIARTCEQAKIDGLQYAWIDTCCIDKSSSAELSESINSMFQWYRESSRCYVYLEDVEEFDRKVPDALINSRWFRRGWTLQELLAPSRLSFFDRFWNHFGDRDGLTPFISQASGIKTDDLKKLEYDLDRVLENSIACKMSWASKRQTTREEDIAYCLLGIFGVSMPLLYGEGRRAFIRLQEEIIKISGDQSIFAWDFSATLFLLVPQYGFELDSYFAPSPANFEASGDIESVQTDYAGSYTKVGSILDITLPIARLRDDNQTFVALLSCRVNVDQSSGQRHQGHRIVGIWIQEDLYYSTNTYRRIRGPFVSSVPRNGHLTASALFDVEKCLNAEVKRVRLTQNFETRPVPPESLGLMHLDLPKFTNNGSTRDQIQLLPINALLPTSVEYTLQPSGLSLDLNRERSFLVIHRFGWRGDVFPYVFLTSVESEFTGLNLRPTCKTSIQQLHVPYGWAEPATRDEWDEWTRSDPGRPYHSDVDGWIKLEPGYYSNSEQSHYEWAIRAVVKEVAIHQYQYLRLSWDIKVLHG